LRQGKRLAEADNPFEAEDRKRAAAQRRKQRKKTKLSYKDQRELDQLPEEIETLEASIATVHEEIAEPKFYSQGPETVQEALRKLADAEEQLESRVERWSELEVLQASLQSTD
jgi:ATP-binding cassette subfamily F protein uup